MEELEQIVDGMNGEQPVSEVSLLQDQVKDLNDKYLRALAELDNTRKRSKKECQDALRQGKESSLKVLLPVFDSVDRATSTNGNKKILMEGLRLIQDQFSSALFKIDVKKVEAAGKKFDPTSMEAVSNMTSDEVEAGWVVNELQTGYIINGVVLRPCLVVVSSGK